MDSPVFPPIVLPEGGSGGVLPAGGAGPASVPGGCAQAVTTRSLACIGVVAARCRGRREGWKPVQRHGAQLNARRQSHASAMFIGGFFKFVISPFF